MNVLPLILILGGAVIVGWLYFWSRQRQTLTRATSMEQILQDMPTVSGDSAVLVSTEHGQLIYANEASRRWLALNGGTPNLEYIAQRAQPMESFLNLLAREGQSSFQLGQRWVEASSHYVPSDDGLRTVVVMREMSSSTGTRSNDVVDLSRAMHIINEIGETVNAGMGVEQVLQTLLTIVNKEIAAEAGEVCLWNPEDRVLQQRGWLGDARYLLDLTNADGVYQLDEGVTGWIGRHRKPVLISDRSDPTAIQPRRDHSPFQSIVAVPLNLGERFVGTFELFDMQPGRFTEADLALLQALGKPIAIAIYNAELYAEQVQRVSDIASLQSLAEQGQDGDIAPVYSALNGRIANLLDAEMSGIFLYDDDRKRLIAQPPFHGIPDHVARGIIIPLPDGSYQREIWENHSEWISNEVAGEPLVDALSLRPLIDVTGIQNTAFVPLDIGAERIGVLAVSNKRTGDFHPRDVQNLRVLAAQAAIVVQNLRLFQREQRIDTELVGLQEITHAIALLDQENAFYAELNQRIARLLNASMCGILLYNENEEALIARLPFHNVPDELAQAYRIDIKPGTVIEELWLEDDYWLTNTVQSNTLVFEAGLDQIAETIGVQSTLLVKLSASGKQIGIIQVSNKLNNEEFTDSDARLLMVFATQAAAIIENARLYHRAQRDADTADRLRRVAELASTVLTTEETFAPVMYEIAQLTHSELVFINVLDQVTGSLITYPRWIYGGEELTEPIVYDVYSPGFEHSVALSGQTFFSNDIMNDKRVLPAYRHTCERFGINSAVMVPLRVGDKKLGELGIGNRATELYSDEDVNSLKAVSVQIAAVLDRLLLYEATGQNLSRRMEELDAVSRVSTELTLTLDLDAVLGVICEEVERATGAKHSTVVLLRPTDEWEHPDRPEVLRRIGSPELGDKLADIEREAITRGADPVLVANYEISTLKPLKSTMNSAIAAAVLYIDQVVGVIHLFDESAGRFDDRAAAFLMTMATKASIAYGNDVRYREQLESSERLRRRVDQLNRIFELGQMLQSSADPVMILEAIAYSVQQSVGFDVVVMLLADRKSGMLRRVAHAGMPLQSFEESRSLMFSLDQTTEMFKEQYRISESYFFPMEEVEDWHVVGMSAMGTSFDGSRTLDGRGKDAWHDGDMLLVKLNSAGGDLLGVMSLDRPHNNRRPDRSAIEVLEIFAHQASTTIENTRLYQRSLENAEQEIRLNEIVETISSTLDRSEIIESVAQGTLKLLPFDHITVVLRHEEFGYDVYRVEADADTAKITAMEHRLELGNTALSRTFDDRVDHLYRVGDKDGANFEDLKAWQGRGEHVSLVLPLLTGGETLGVMHLGSNDEHTWQTYSELRALLRRLAQIMASSIQNSRLFNRAVNLQVLTDSVVQSIQQGIVVLDNSGRIISANEFMQNQYGWNSDATRRDLFDYQPEWKDILYEDLRIVLEEGIHRERFGHTSQQPDDISRVQNFYIYPLHTAQQVQGAVLLVEDVTERTLLEQNIQTRAGQLQALTDVSTRITASLERDEVISLALEEMGQIVDCDMITMWRRNGSYMVLEGAHNIPEPDYELGMRIRFAENERTRQLVESQRAIVVSSEAGIKDNFVPGDPYTKSWLGVPLVNHGHVVGMVVINNREPDYYESPSDQNVAFAFGSQVAIALANADLFEQMFDRTNELGTLLEAAQATSLTLDLEQVYRTIVELMFSALEMDDCAIMIWDEVDNELVVQVDMNRNGDPDRITPKGTTFDLRQYPARMQALRDREVVVILNNEDEEDADTPFPQEVEELREFGDGARLLVPLVIRDQSIGLIQLEQQTRDRAVTQQKVRLAQALGSQVAIAIYNARLSSETTANFEELLTINALSRAISSTLNLEDMLEIVRDQVAPITEANEFYLALYDAEAEAITFPLVVLDNQEQQWPPRKLASDEVSYIIKNRRTLTLGADYYSLDELRKSMGIANGEGDVKSYMGVPLESANEVMGVLAVRDSKRTRAFDVNVERILSTIASQLGAAIQNARLYTRITNFADDLHRVVEEQTRELEDERDQLDTLYQITSELSRTLEMDRLLNRALGMVAKAVNADDGAIMLSNPITDKLYSRATLHPIPSTGNGDSEYPAHPAEGLATWLIQNEHVLVIPDLHEAEYWDKDAPGAAEWRSALAVLLETNDDIQGVMVMLSREVAAFSESQLKLLVAAGNQVAFQINNAELYQLIREQAERLGTLLRAEQEEAERNSAILEGIGDGVVLSDANEVVVLFNNAAERILQLPREQAVGQSLGEIARVYGDMPALWANAIGAWSLRVRTNPEEDFTDRRLDLGDTVVSVNLSPVYIGDQFLGTVSVFRDITRDVEVERIKSEFITRVSHEFRTPLTPIKGYTDLLLMGAAGQLSDQQDNALGKIKSNVERLTGLVDDVLRIANIDRGERAIFMQINLDELVNDVVTGIGNRVQNANKNITTTVAIGDDVPDIEADRDKLSQVITNIVENAFNYTLANGKIDVRVSMDADKHRVQIEVEDSGLGIPEEFHDKIWRRFERYDDHAVELDVAGTGLGLAIAKELVTLHHGDIWFESEVGKGTTFYVSLPVRQARRVTSTLEAVIADTGTLGE